MKNIINVSEYPYGKITKTLRNACIWLNKNRKHIIEYHCQNMERGSGEFAYFDFPDYFDMPKKISSRLESDEVDFIQENMSEEFREQLSEEVDSRGTD